LYPQEIVRHQALNKASRSFDAKVEKAASDFKVFQEEFQEMQRLMAPYYLRALTSTKHWTVAFLSFLHLKDLEATRSQATVMTANFLDHQYANQAFEISFMRATARPAGSLAICSTILLKNGFTIEGVNLERDGDRVLVRFVGSFSDKGIKTEQTLSAMAKSANDIFDEAQAEYHKRDLWLERSIRFLYKLARPFFGLLTPNQGNAPGLFRNLYALCGDLEISRPETSEMKPDSTVKFTGDRKKRSGEYSTFEIETEDFPRGLTAFIASFFRCGGLTSLNFTLRIRTYSGKDSGSLSM
jgi:hypothetical protein